MPYARTITALILVGSLIGCSSSSGLPTQRAYNVASIETPQSVSFYCGTLLAVAPAILPNDIEGGVGITPRLSQWLLGLHAGAYGPNGYLRVSAGFVDLVGIASYPEAPTTEYTVLHNGTAVIVVQNDLPALYPPVNPSPGTGVVVRVVGSSARVMPNPGLPPQLCTPGPLQIQPAVLASYPSGMTHSFVGAGGVVYMHYPSGGMGTGF